MVLSPYTSRLLNKQDTSHILINQICSSSVLCIKSPFSEICKNTSDVVTHCYAYTIGPQSSQMQMQNGLSITKQWGLLQLKCRYVLSYQNRRHQEAQKYKSSLTKSYLITAELSALKRKKVNSQANLSSWGKREYLCTLPHKADFMMHIF